jgi:hypothetical protein
LEVSSIAVTDLIPLYDSFLIQFGYFILNLSRRNQRGLYQGMANMWVLAVRVTIKQVLKLPYADCSALAQDWEALLVAG